MMDGKRVIAVIPARGGSKTVPRKNLRLLGDKPLLAWSIEAAQAASGVDRVIVSTDDMEIAVVAERYGAEIYERPAALACDSALVIDAIKDLIGTLRQEGETAELMVLLEPTCPFRQPEDISVCLAALANGRFDSVATFKDAVLNPHRAWRIVEGQPTEFITGAVPWLPRQQLPRAYQLNGAVYAFDMEGVSQQERALLFGRRGAVVMPPERSVDIDTEADFLMAETMLGVANG